MEVTGQGCKGPAHSLASPCPLNQKKLIVNAPARLCYQSISLMLSFPAATLMYLPWFVLEGNGHGLCRHGGDMKVLTATQRKAAP